MYEYYVDMLGLRGRLEEEQRRAELAEFVSVQEYVKNPYQAVMTGSGVPCAAPGPPLPKVPARGGRVRVGWSCGRRGGRGIGCGVAGERPLLTRGVPSFRPLCIGGRLKGVGESSGRGIARGTGRGKGWVGGGSAFRMVSLPVWTLRRYAAGPGAPCPARAIIFFNVCPTLRRRGGGRGCQNFWVGGFPTAPPPPPPPVV